MVILLLHRTHHLTKDLGNLILGARLLREGGQMKSLHLFVQMVPVVCVDPVSSSSPSLQPVSHLVYSVAKGVGVKLINVGTVNSLRV